MSRASAIPFVVRRHLRAAAVAAGLLLAGSALGQSGDATQGHGVARIWCVACHVVDEDQKAASAAGAPSFMAVAAAPSTTAASLHGFLASPRHPPMPDFQLSRQQLDDVSAYILSLKAR